MPFKSRVSCNWPGCPALTNDRFCEQHGKEGRRRQDLRRASSPERGYSTKRWQAYRRAFLREHPLCVGEGCHAVAVIVDHIIPVHGQEDPLFWPPSNHQSLCFSCHEKKKARERGLNVR